jgi:hypothetical protein
MQATIGVATCIWQHVWHWPALAAMKGKWIVSKVSTNCILFMHYKNRDDACQSEQIGSHLISWYETLSKWCLPHGKTRENAYTLHNKNTTLRPFLPNESPIIHFLNELTYICQNVNGDGGCNSMQLTTEVSIKVNVQVAKNCLSQSPSNSSFVYK